MTAINHALTGALIGLTVGNPILALGLAISSHFILDAIPHYGEGPNSITSRRFNTLLLIDIGLCVALVLILALGAPANWLLAAGCAFAAASPDFMWLKKYWLARRGQKRSGRPNPVLRFHAGIQWFERPIGAVIEMAWAVAGFILLKVFIV